MKINMSNWKLYVKNDKFDAYIYRLALLLVLIPMFIVLFFDRPFGPNFIKIWTLIAGSTIILGKSLTMICKEKGDKSKQVDIGIIIGLLLGVILYA